MHRVHSQFVKHKDQCDVIINDTHISFQIFDGFELANCLVVLLSSFWLFRAENVISTTKALSCRQSFDSDELHCFTSSLVFSYKSYRATVPSSPSLPSLSTTHRNNNNQLQQQHDAKRNETIGRRSKLMFIL